MVLNRKLVSLLAILFLSCCSNRNPKIIPNVDIVGSMKFGNIDLSTTVIFSITDGNRLDIGLVAPQYHIDIFWEGNRVAWAAEDSVTQENVWTILDTVSTIKAIREAYLFTLSDRIRRLTI